MAALIQSTIILHNWFIDFNDGHIDAEVDNACANLNWMFIGGDEVDTDQLHLVEGAEARRRRDLLRDYLCKL